ncbi:hypothetical protein ACUN0C_01775 [Faunimonas sp. B44]|uniref:hypothetical protein n=1 Tax=Faunimonas sp. B44 TaxID=3461493 RepID=UPI0040444885
MATFKTVILHIGINKTGSTSIQDALSGNAETLLAEAGIQYAGNFANHSVPLYTMFSEHALSYHANVRRGVTSGERLRALRAELFDSYEAILAEPKAGTLLLSGEDLSLLSEAAVSRLKVWLTPKASEVKVIAYLRHPRSWSSSEAAQRIKGGVTLEELEASPPHPWFRRRLEPWLSSFGRDRVAVFDYGAACRHPGGLVGHFSDLIGAGPALRGSLAAQTATNIRLSEEAVLLMSRLNAIRPLFTESGLMSPRRHLRERKVLAEVHGAPFSLSSQALDRVEAESRDDLEWVRDTFGVKLEAEPEPPQPERPIRITEEALESIAILISDLILMQKRRPPPSGFRRRIRRFRRWVNQRLMPRLALFRPRTKEAPRPRTERRSRPASTA